MLMGHGIVHRVSGAKMKMSNSVGSWDSGISTVPYFSIGLTAFVSLR